MKRIKSFANGHLDTLYPYLIRRSPRIKYKRERISTTDQDFLDLDWSKTGSRKLVILSHGFEGSSDSKYIRGMVFYLNKNGYDCLVWNYRSCSGEMNRSAKFYHSGVSDDLDEVVKHCLKDSCYESLYLVGFSMGGNITLKYLGEKSNKVHKKIKKAVCFSVPIDLSDASSQLEIGLSKYTYTANFLKTLKKKIYAKRQQLQPLNIDVKKALKVKNLRQFDDIVTGPLHGFKDAEEYYSTQSAKNFLEKIKISCLIVNAKNDPFLGKKCFPQQFKITNPLIEFETPEQGGHVGFMLDYLGQKYWSETRTQEFLQKD